MHVRDMHVAGWRLPRSVLQVLQVLRPGIYLTYAMERGGDRGGDGSVALGTTKGRFEAGGADWRGCQLLCAGRGRCCCYAWVRRVVRG